MARVTVHYQWATGETLTTSVEVDNSFPDAIAQARCEAMRAWQTALATLQLCDEDEPDD